MITATIQMNLYEFEELDERAQNKAIWDHRYFLLQTITVDDFIGCGDPEYGDTPESMFDEEYDMILTDDEYVAESIIMNDYLFFSSGEIANTVSYCGSHPLAGKRFLTVQGTEYEI